MSALDTHPEPLADESATLQSQRVWRSAGQQDLDFESQRLRNRLRAKMFGVDASPINIGRFTVLETVGSGGMGVVYAAYDQELDRRVAVKLLRATREDDASIGKGRLLREAQALAKLSHPNVVQVYEVGTFDDRVFLAMEFLAGPNLRAWLLDEPHTWRVVLRHFIEAGQGLAAAHQQGIIHRDFKPANLLFGGDGRVRVVDFGLARATADVRLELVEPTSSRPDRAFATELTQTGEIMGTPAYMSPEQARHEPVDARSDQYSFCVALYEALFGMRPHAGRSTAEVLVAVAEGQVHSPPRNTKVPAHIVRAVMRGLSAEPEQRFPTMDALLEQLSPRERGRFRMMSVGALAVVGIGAFMLIEREPCPSFDAALSDAWGSASRASIEAAFSASGSAGAASALDLTGARLDAYAHEWLAARQDTCEAHHVRREQSAQLHDQRVACLVERHAELAMLTQALAVADPVVVEQAPRAAAELSPISACGDLSSLQRKGQLDPVRQELRVRLAQAKAQYTVGHYEPALDALEDVVAAAHEHGAPEVEAAGLFHRGAIHQRRRVHAPANAAFEQAVDLAEEGGDDELAARAWIYLAQGQAILGHIDQADRSIRRARAKARRLHDEHLDHEVGEAQVVAAWQAGRLDEAIEGQRAVLGRVERSFGPNHPRTADAELRLAHILGDAGHHAEAQEGYERALEALGRVFGPAHPALARALFDIGMDHREAGRNAEALQALEDAERRFVSALGADAPELLDVNKALADLAQQRGDLEETDRRILELVALSQRTGRPEPEQLDLLSLQAMVASQRGDHAKTIEICHAYLDQLRHVPTNADIEVQALFMRTILVTELGAAGRHDEAEPAARGLIEELAHQEEDDAIASLRAHAWLVIGRATEARGEREPAAVAYRAGLESLAAADLAGPESAAVKARLQWGLGRALGPSQAAAARVLVVDAREALARAEAKAVELPEMDAWLHAYQ